MIKGISLIAPSGSGKSTTARLIVEHLTRLGVNARIIKLAQPLYELQQRFYEAAGLSIDPFAQNQKLLEDIARHLRSLRPDSLVRRFFESANKAPNDIVVNDDLRDVDTDLPALVNAGFVIVRISASEKTIARRLDARNDLQTQRNSALNAVIRKIEARYVLVNDDDNIESYRERVNAFVEGLLWPAKQNALGGAQS
jgi:adenylate kinase family enzyme